jgi:hypothetical protein
MFGEGMSIPASVHEEPTLYAQQRPEDLAKVHEAPTISRRPGMDLLMESSLGEAPLPTEAVRKPESRSPVWAILAAVLGVCIGGAVVLLLWTMFLKPAPPQPAPAAPAVAAPTPAPPPPPAAPAAPAAAEPAPAEPPQPAAAAAPEPPPPSTLQESGGRGKHKAKAKHKKKRARR